MNAPSSSVRVGHVFLDTRQRRLHMLNSMARQLHNEGVPFAAEDLARQPMLTSTGDPVASSDVPLLVAWRKREAVDAMYLLPREGGHCPVHWSASPLSDREGKLLGVVATVTCHPPRPDIHVLAELAHDLRTPLQSLKLLCRLLDRFEPHDPEWRRTIDALQASADRAVQIAMELLEVSRQKAAPHRGATTAWFALVPFLESLAAEQAVAAESKGLQLATQFGDLSDWEIHIDKIRLGRVLSNLLVNAVRYTPRGRVEFSARWRDEARSRHVDLSVIDTGPGISEEEQESIFQPFERGQAGKEGDSGGSGLGLAVVDRLVEELGLTLDVYSEYGKGSAFHLLVPASMLRPSAVANQGAS